MMNPGLVMEYFIVWSLPVVEEVPYFEGASVVFSCKQSVCLHSALLTKTHTQVHSWSAPVAEWLLPGYSACHRTAESLVRFQSGGVGVCRASASFAAHYPPEENMVQRCIVEVWQKLVEYISFLINIFANLIFFPPATSIHVYLLFSSLPLLPHYCVSCCSSGEAAFMICVPKTLKHTFTSITYFLSCVLSLQLFYFL